ncbi:MAG: aminotransferase class I/II-fold pyridoxal phosphate-dependent enzyme [Synechococcus lacustris]|jgi:8-amino-7-oxononanoate synthase
MAEQNPQRRRQLRVFAAGAPGLLTAPGGSALLDLASNDTLALSRHPALVQAAQAAIAASGVGAAASRLVSGTRPEHAQLEQALASWLGRGRVLLFPSGFQANIAAVAALADRHSLVLADRLIHHSLLVGIQACGARLQRFAHNDLADLEQRLERARQGNGQRRLLVVSESLFSMEGSSPNLPALAALCQRHQAQLLLDEAHALGILGPGGRGLGHGLAAVSLISGTFGKAFGSGGAFLACAGPLGEELLQTSGPFRYSTALAPALAAAALASLELISGPYGDRARAELASAGELWREQLAAAGWPRPPGQGPILALKLGSDSRALQLQAQLEAAGLLVVAIRPPSVPEGEACLRISLRPGLPEQTLARMLTALEKPLG